MATMEDVAKAAKVSRATVSRVLSNYPSIKPETRQQVMYWVRELHYEPNQVAQNLAGHHTNLIGVLFSDLSNPLYVSIFSLRAFPVHERSLAIMNARSFRSQHSTIFVLCQPIHVVFSLLAMNASVHLSILTRDDSRISRCGAR